MKRCDNCGWYNHNSSLNCEKCGEPLENSLESLTADEELDDSVIKIIPSSPFSETEPKPAAPEPAIANRTLRAGEEVRKKPEKLYSATVRDARSLIAEEGDSKVAKKCPKCQYPIAGNPDTCPNCGELLPHRTAKDAARFKATMRDGVKQLGSDAQVESFAPAPSQPPLSPSLGKATMRDVPKGLVEAETVAGSLHIDDSQEVFKLVPIVGTEGPSLYMRIGDLVQIGDKRYRFVK